LKLLGDRLVTAEGGNDVNIHGINWCAYTSSPQLQLLSAAGQQSRSLLLSSLKQQAPSATGQRALPPHCCSFKQQPDSSAGHG
jgi:hypothetical protein